MANDEEIKKFQKQIEGPLRGLLFNLYSNHIVTYERFRQRIGPQCPICKSAAKFMYASEVKRKGQEFLSRLETGNWDSYE